MLNYISLNDDEQNNISKLIRFYEFISNLDSYIQKKVKIKEYTSHLNKLYNNIR